MICAIKLHISGDPIIPLLDSELSSYTLVQGYVYKEEWHQGLFYIVYFIVLISMMTMDWEIL